MGHSGEEVSVSVNGVEKTLNNAFSDLDIQVQQVIGYRTYDEKVGILSSFNIASPNFNDIFEKVTYTDADLSGYPYPFERDVRVGKGLRCKQENGWILTGCAYLNVITVSNGVAPGGQGADWDHAVINNSCVAGFNSGDPLDAEMGNFNQGGVSVSCTKITLVK